MLGFRKGYALEQLEDSTLPSVATFQGTPMSPAIGDGSSSLFYFDQNGLSLWDGYGLSDQLGRVDVVGGKGMIRNGLKYSVHYAVFINDKLVEASRFREPPNTQVGYARFYEKYFTVTGTHKAQPITQSRTLIDNSVDFIAAGVNNTFKISLPEKNSGWGAVRTPITINSVNSDIFYFKEGIKYQIVNTLPVSTATINITGTCDALGYIEDSAVLVDTINFRDAGILVGMRITNGRTGVTTSVSKVEVNTITTSINLHWNNGDNYTIQDTNVNLNAPQRGDRVTCNYYKRVKIFGGHRQLGLAFTNL